MTNLLGIYEKALPAYSTWSERLDTARALGFDFVEVSVDETEERMHRLFSGRSEQNEMVRAIRESGVPVQSMCFSAHRRFPMGSRDPAVRARAMELMERAVDFAAEVGIRVIQLAGYDVYYEPNGPDTHDLFLQNLRVATSMAARRQVMLALEIMDTNYINSVTRYLWFASQVVSPWLAVYPDLGNLAAWGHDVSDELRKGRHCIVGVHVKDTLPVRPGFTGKFKEVPFGEGGTDFIAAFHTLKEMEYSGPFLIEMWTGKAPDALAEVAAARRFVLERMRAAGYTPGEN